MPMPPMNTKNLPQSLAAMDLGLGDALQQQVEDTADELKKKNQATQAQQPLYGAASLALLSQNGVASGGIR